MRVDLQVVLLAAPQLAGVIAREGGALGLHVREVGHADVPALLALAALLTPVETVLRLLFVLLHNAGVDVRGELGFIEHVQHGVLALVVSVAGDGHEDGVRDHAVLRHSPGLGRADARAHKRVLGRARLHQLRLLGDPLGDHGVRVARYAEDVLHRGEGADQENVRRQEKRRDADSQDQPRAQRRAGRGQDRDVHCFSHWRARVM